MVPYLDADARDRLFRLAQFEAPKEAVGLLQGTFSKHDHTVIEFWPRHLLTNAAADPTTAFVVNEEETNEIRAYLNNDKRRYLLALWHSHPKTLPNLSEEDQQVMWLLKVPMLVVSLQVQQMKLFTFGDLHQAKRPIVEWGKWER